MSAFEIPLVPAQAQKISVSLSGVQYQFTLVWNVSIAAWVLDIDDSNDVEIVHGIPLVTGTDLLGQYGYLGFVGQLIAQTDQAINVPPTFENLGIDSHLYYVTEEA